MFDHIPNRAVGAGFYPAPTQNYSSFIKIKKEGQCPSFFYIILLKKLIMQHADRSVGIVFINEH